MLDSEFRLELFRAAFWIPFWAFRLHPICALLHDMFVCVYICMYIHKYFLFIHMRGCKPRTACFGSESPPQVGIAGEVVQALSLRLPEFGEVQKIHRRTARVSVLQGALPCEVVGGSSAMRHFLGALLWKCEPPGRRQFEAFEGGRVQGVANSFGFSPYKTSPQRRVALAVECFCLTIPRKTCLITCFASVGVSKRWPPSQFFSWPHGMHLQPHCELMWPM